MPSHSDPSIEQIISSATNLSEKFDQLTLSLLKILKARFGEYIAFPTAVEANILHYQENIARYPDTLKSDEFINGAVAMLPKEFSDKNPQVEAKVKELVKQVVTISLDEMIDTFEPSYIRTVSLNRIYISVGACIAQCSAADWHPVPKDFYAAAIAYAIWTPASPYPGYPEPVNIAPMIPR